MLHLDIFTWLDLQTLTHTKKATKKKSRPTFPKEKIHQFMNSAERQNCAFILEASGLVKEPFAHSRSQLITTSVTLPQLVSATEL